MATSNAFMIAIFMNTCIEYVYLSREKEHRTKCSDWSVTISSFSLCVGVSKKNIIVPNEKRTLRRFMCYVFWR